MPLLTGSIIFFGLAAFVQVLFAFVLKDIIDAAVRTETKLLFVSIKFALYIIFGSIVIEGIGIVFKRKFAERTIRNIKKDLVSNIMSKSIRGYGEKSNSYYINLLTQDMDMINTDYLSQIVGVAFNIMGFSFSLVAIVYISWKLTLSIILITLIPMLVPSLLGSTLNKFRKKLSLGNENYVSVLKQIFEGFEVVKTFNAKEKILQVHNKRNFDKENSFFKYKSADDLMGVLSNNLGFLVHMSALAVGSFLVIRGELTVGALIAAIQIMNGIVQPINEIVQRMTMIKSTEVVREKIADELKVDKEEEKGDNISLVGESIVLKKVSFGYKEENVLSNINYKFEKGKKYAIIGSSGSGKTTLLKLLMGYYTEYSGEILLDGIEVKEIKPENIYEVLSAIHQNVFLFDDNFINNITLYSGYKMETIEETVAQANLTDLYSKLKNEGIDSLGEYGSILSGGEKQRISIARSLIRKSRIILVDEATAALDPQNAEAIYDTLLSLDNVMVIAITHDWDENLLSKFDEVIRVDKGMIIDKPVQHLVG